MTKQTPAEELIALRAVLRRLQAREAALAREVEADGAARAPQRPGWPIQRMPTQPVH